VTALNAVLLIHREEIEERYVCSDCDAGRMAVRKVRIVRTKACCAISFRGRRLQRPMILRQSGSLLRFVVDVLGFKWKFIFTLKPQALECFGTHVTIATPT